ncbi:CocE/NonD family hydrolase [Spirillospora sp. NPDC050679]
MPFELHLRIGAEEVDAAAEQFSVRTRDGVSLATDVYLPQKPGRLPAILVRTPYDKASRYTRLRHMAKRFVEAGYVFIAQDVRGKFRSGGQTMPYTTDVVDAYDTLDWIVAQPWSNGEVGLLGASYYGYTAWAGVASGHPALRAAVCQVTGIDMADGHVASRWRLDVPQLAGVDDLLQIWTENDCFWLGVDYNQRPVDAIEEAVAALGTRAPALDTLLRNIEIGQSHNPYGERSPLLTTQIPILHWVEWFDPGLAPMGMSDFHHFHHQPATRHLHYLRAAAGDHSGLRLSDLPLTDDTDPAVNDAALALHVAREADELIEFFDVFLKATGKLGYRTRWEIGNGDWNTSQTWPPATTTRRFYPTSSQELAAAPHTGSGGVSWTHDPKSPTPSNTNASEMWELLSNFPDDRDISRGPGALGFDTESLSDPLEIAGTPTAALTLQIDGPSTHLFVRLLDVAPDGTARTISSGQSVVDAATNDVQIRIPLQPTAYRFAAGHRVRMHLSSTHHPIFAIHPGTDENPWTAHKRVRRQHQLRVGGDTSSWIALPTLPATPR